MCRGCGPKKKKKKASKFNTAWSSCCGAAETIRLGTMRLRVQSPASLSGFKDPSLLGLWHRPAAVAPIRPMAWEPPCAAGAALKSKKKSLTQLFFSIRCLTVPRALIKNSDSRVLSQIYQISVFGDESAFLISTRKFESSQVQ